MEAGPYNKICKSFVHMFPTQPKKKWLKNTSNIIIQVHVQLYFIDCMLMILPVKYINNMLPNMQIT
jgi:hypothetical protein